ncbi:hypothetical protein G6F35_015533 [Rhizopus arrhizus]|nr:hypothetical protein G6F35_015533 [Rhizopus arrhizus]
MAPWARAVGTVGSTVGGVLNGATGGSTGGLGGVLGNTLGNVGSAVGNLLNGNLNGTLGNLGSAVGGLVGGTLSGLGLTKPSAIPPTSPKAPAAADPNAGLIIGTGGLVGNVGQLIGPTTTSLPIRRSTCWVCRWSTCRRSAARSMAWAVRLPVAAHT